MIPGLHINTVAELLYYFGAGGFLGAAILYALYGISVALDSIYSIALNIPDGATGIAPTAAQGLSAKGQVGKGIYSYLIGGIFAVGVSIVSIPFLLLALPYLQPILQANMFLVILFVASLVLLSDFSPANLAVFIIAGLFGMLVLNADTAANLIFPMFIGFFTLPVLMLKTRNVEVEENYKAKIKWEIPTIAALVTAFAYLIPGVATPMMIVALAGLFTRIRDDELVVALGAINASSLVFSMLMIDIIGKARVGVAIVAQNMHHTFIFGDLMLALIGASAFGIAALLILSFLPQAVRFFSPFSHPALKLLLGIYLTLLVFLVTGALGITVMGIACVIGTVALLLRARRTNLMGSIIISSLIYYFGRR